MFMSEEKKVVELKDKDLEKVSGGSSYTRDPDGWFDIDEIVEEDNTGIKYRIIRFDSTEYHNLWGYTNWFLAEVVFVPESEMNNTSIGNTKFVNSSFVK